MISIAWYRSDMFVDCGISQMHAAETFCQHEASSISSHWHENAHCMFNEGSKDVTIAKLQSSKHRV